MHQTAFESEMNMKRFLSSGKFSLLLSISVIYCISLYAGLLGIDYGIHWDETFTTKYIHNVIHKGRLLPTTYYYPSMMYNVAIVAVSPSFIYTIYQNAGLYYLNSYIAKRYESSKSNEQDNNAPDKKTSVNKLKEIQYLLFYKASQKSTLLNIRTLFLILSTLSIVWIYLAVYYLRGNQFESVIASALYAFSWEINYHSRWAVSDALMWQFITLCCLFIILAFKKESKTYLYLKLSAISCGLVVGSKYPGGLILISILLATYFLYKMKRIDRLYYRFFILILVFAASYIASTPGTILDPGRFLYGILRAKDVYKSGWFGHTVNPGFDHMARIVVFFSTAAFSRYSYISLLLFILSLTGLYNVYRLSREKADRYLYTTIFIFPLIYFLYLGCQKVMVIRNSLVIFPFLVILSSLGISFIAQRIPQKLRILVFLGILAVLSFNIYWLYSSAFSIKYKSDMFADAYNYIKKNQHKSIFVSASLREYIKKSDGKLPENVFIKSSDKAQYSLLYYPDTVNWIVVKANRQNYILKWFGPYEVNLKYYPTWNVPHIILMYKKNTNELVFEEDYREFLKKSDSLKK
ncbi:MAG: glycosyltransferase family 39 protein [Candidatus Coatesbacteria bacterium]|nr:glycosyltransferase family 39 protein [Candidatus Coatesbacteria bacterium]